MCSKCVISHELRAGNWWVTATHCNALQYTATNRTVLQHTATQKLMNYCNNLQRTETLCKARCCIIVMNRCLQHTATHCNTLQLTTRYCNTLQHRSWWVRYQGVWHRHCNTLQHTAIHCNTLHHTASHCNTLQHTATLCNTLWHTATQGLMK